MNINMPETIAVDLDEVLGFFIDPLCEYHNSVYGTKYSRADFFSYSYADVWGGTRDDSIDKVYEFFKSRYFLDGIPVVPGAKRGLKELADMGYDLVIVTSRQHVIEEETRRWVAEHFGADTFREIVFGNHWGKSGKKVSKKELCQQLKACALIDDNIGYVKEVAEVDITGILFDLDGSYGWNKCKTQEEEEKVVQQADNITRVRNWAQVVDVFKTRTGA